MDNIVSMFSCLEISAYPIGSLIQFFLSVLKKKDPSFDVDTDVFKSTLFVCALLFLDKNKKRRRKHK